MMRSCNSFQSAFLLLLLFLPANLYGDDTRDLIRILSDVTAAASHRYGARDDKGASLDCLKVFQVGDGGGYWGVYHSLEKGRFGVYLARSKDLLQWERVAVLDEHASQGTIWRNDDGSFLLAYEKDAPNSCWMRLRYYENLSKLSKGEFQNQFDVPRSLAPTAEGTPSFEEVVIENAAAENPMADSSIWLRFHYFKDVRVDRQAAGILRDFKIWEARPLDRVNDELAARGVRGNIGDRDGFQWKNKRYYLQETQYKRNDWSSWRLFLCDAEGMPIERLAVRTHAGSVSFCNPNVTWVTGPKGRKRLAVTLFVPTEGNVSGETGELIYAIDVQSEGKP